MNINPSSPVSISVVMCTFNGDKYLEQQIDSILCQTYPIHELIIQDDCSTDRTVTIIEAYQKRDPRVKLYINEAPLGFNYNFSSAFAKAEGEYIASSDQDDIWRPDKIEILMNHAKIILYFFITLTYSPRIFNRPWEKRTNLMYFTTSFIY